MNIDKQNRDTETVVSFGDEWERFDQSKLNSREVKQIFDEYFRVFPWDGIPTDAEGFDMGCVPVGGLKYWLIVWER
jgi:hypothetical protein